MAGKQDAILFHFRNMDFAIYEQKVDRANLTIKMK